MTRIQERAAALGCEHHDAHKWYAGWRYPVCEPCYDEAYRVWWERGGAK